MCTCVSMIGGYPGYEGMVCVYMCQYDWRVPRVGGNATC